MDEQWYYATEGRTPPRHLDKETRGKGEALTHGVMSTGATVLCNEILGSELALFANRRSYWQKIWHLLCLVGFLSKLIFIGFYALLKLAYHLVSGYYCSLNRWECV